MAEKPKNSKELVWTETELKYLPLVLADKKTQFAVRMDTLALKKSSNKLYCCRHVEIYSCPFLAQVLATFTPVVNVSSVNTV